MAGTASFLAFVTLHSYPICPRPLFLCLSQFLCIPQPFRKCLVLVRAPPLNDDVTDRPGIFIPTYAECSFQHNLTSQKNCGFLSSSSLFLVVYSTKNILDVVPSAEILPPLSFPSCGAPHPHSSATRSSWTCVSLRARFMWTSVSTTRRTGR